MIHFNSNKNRGTNMFARRPRSYLPTVMLIFLALGIIYVLYLNNNLQVKLKSLDDKNKRYHDQHQSLSSQLQVVYEDRSRLENSLQKEKYEHQNVKDELQLQKEALDSALEDASSRHKKQMDDLIVEHQNTKDRLKDALKDLDEAQEQHEKLLNEKNNHQHLTEKHIEDKKNLESQNKDLQDQLSRVQSQADERARAQQEISSQLHESQNLLKDYNGLKDVMKRLGSDVLKLEHEQFDQLSESERRLLFAHFGGTVNHGAELEQQRIQLKQDYQSRQEAALRQQQLREERDRQLAVAQAGNPPALNPQAGNPPSLNKAVGILPDPNLPADNSHLSHNQVPIQNQQNICHLPPAPGSCSQSSSLFYFDPHLSSCRSFIYTGCDGNANQFSSIEACEAKCLDNKNFGDLNKGVGNIQVPNPGNVEKLEDNKSQRDAEKNEAKSQNQQPAPAAVEEQAGAKSEDSDPDAGDLNPRQGLDSSRRDFNPVDGVQEKAPLAFENEDDGVEEAGGLEEKGENEEVKNSIDAEEAKAKKEEEKAREELKGIESQNNDKVDDNEEDDNVDPNQALKELSEMHKKQQELAKEKEGDLAKFAALKAGEKNVKGKVEYDEVKSRKDGGVDDESNQMLEPPGAARVPADDKPVIDQPDALPNQVEDRPANLYEQYQKNGQDQDEEDEEEEEEYDADDRNDADRNGLGRRIL